MSLREWQTQLGRALILPDAPALCELPALHGIEGRRLALYEELLFNTVLETLQSIYPYTYRLLSQNGDAEDAWKALADQYRRAYPNESHKLMGAVSAFPKFLAEQTDLMALHPFLADLALYEWLEMEVMNLPDVPVAVDLPQAIPPVEELNDYHPAWNPARQLTQFRYHVPEILEQFKPDDALPDSQTIRPRTVDILIYRDPQTLDARFFCLNELTALLMQLSQDEGVSYYSALAQLQETSPALQLVPLDIIALQAADLFANCLEAGILLGSQRIHASST